MATKLIEKYSEALRSSIPVVMEKAPTKKSKDPLDVYRDCKKNGDPFDVLFSYVAPNGDLSLKDMSGVTIMLEGKTLSMDLPYYDEKNMAQFLGKSFTVKVQKIDEKKNTVYVRSGRDHRNSVRTKIRREIRTELEAGNEPVIVGKVVTVNDYRATVDLMGMGVQGICKVSDWSRDFVRNLRTVCKKGDILEFKVYSVTKSEKGKPERFILSRRDFSDDHWMNIPKEYTEKDAVIGVKCIECPKGKTFWWGMSELIPGIEIMGDYTKRYTPESMVVGIAYKCKVIRSDPENHKFQVVPFDVTDSDIGTEKAVKFFKSKEKVR